MAAQGRNEGFHVLDEFVCEAIHAPTVPLANPANQGQNEGMSVAEELVFEAGQEATSDETDDPDSRRSSRPEARDAALKSVIEPLATYISASSDPRGALALAMELLLAELNGMDQAAADVLEDLRHAGHSSKPRTGKPAELGAAPDPGRHLSSGSS